MYHYVDMSLTFFIKVLVCINNYHLAINSDNCFTSLRLYKDIKTYFVSQLHNILTTTCIQKSSKPLWYL